jgi:hypothetical protein
MSFSTSDAFVCLSVFGNAVLTRSIKLSAAMGVASACQIP